MKTWKHAEVIFFLLFGKEVKQNAFEISITEVIKTYPLLHKNLLQEL